jgi:hypothetical protein
MVDPKGVKPTTAADGAGVHVKNIINMLIKDLTEDDHKEIEHEL